MKLPKNGFTLVEILIAISIISIVFGIVLTSAAAIQRNGRDTQRKADLASLQSALQQYYADQNFYPDDDANTPLKLSGAGAITSLTSRVGNPDQTQPIKTYLSSIPKDPTSGTATPYCYKAYSSVADFPANATPCDNASTAKCFYYAVYAKLENSTGNSYTCNSQTYNYQITPN
ncbi:type II secretion system protein [Candidatus Daviesbacteria bacterium]|nr:type II secretion system protein [Candidatus Daviesbacteria bacterium]